MKYRHLPQRFWVESDYEEGEERLKKSYFSMKSADFKKIYNKKISPFLRTKGYKASGFKALKEDENFYYQVFFGTGKYGGEGTMSLLVHPKGFPTKDELEFSDAKKPYYHLMSYDFKLPNGREWIPMGRNAEEGQETVHYLLEILEHELEVAEECYRKEWEQDILSFRLDNLKEQSSVFRKKYGLRSCLSNYEIDTATHIARFYRLREDMESAKMWVTKAREMEEAWAAQRQEVPHLRVILLHNNILNLESAIYWTDENSKIFWNRK